MGRRIMYGGKLTSLGKTYARSWAYNHLSRTDLYHKHHIVIASRDCGDIQYLLHHKVKPKQIIACDVDPIAIKEAKKYGVRISPYAYIEDTAVWAREHYDVGSINVDLCVSLKGACPVLLPVLATAAPLTFLTFRRGRDGMDDIGRKVYTALHIGKVWNDEHHYMSSTIGSVGSAMSVVAFIGRVRTEQVKAARLYGCKDCDWMGKDVLVHRREC